jgi:hypothetical protein
MVVLDAGGGGLLLLNERHPLSANSRSRQTRGSRMLGFLEDTGRWQGQQQSTATVIYQIIPPSRLFRRTPFGSSQWASATGL